LELIDRIELHIGGNAANTATSLAKLGVSVALIGKVGNDAFGAYLRGAFAAQGVDVCGLATDVAAPTAATIVTVHSDAERSFIHVPGANATFTAADVDWKATEGAKILHIAGPQLMTAFEGEGLASVAAEGQRRGFLTTLDTVMNPRSIGWDGIASALPYLDWAVPSLEEAAQLTGERDPVAQTKKFKAHGAKNVAIKLGADGCYVAPADAAAFTVPPLPVIAVDSLGAGDAWSAGFVTGLLHDWPLEKTARLANAVGACCVQHLGATTGVIPLKDTLLLLDNP
jgi:sugar/nucleoside kinase (ribokinase family)